MFREFLNWIVREGPEFEEWMKYIIFLEMGVDMLYFYNRINLFAFFYFLILFVCENNMIHCFLKYCIQNELLGFKIFFHSVNNEELSIVINKET